MNALRPFVLAAALLLGLAGTASAATHQDVSYAVHFEGTGTYHKVDRDEYGIDWIEEEVNVGFSFTGDISDGVVFRDGHPFDTDADDLARIELTGSWETRGSGTTPLACPIEPDMFPHGLMRVTEPELAPLDPEQHVYIRPFDELWASFDCGGSHPGAGLHGDGPVGEDGKVAPGEHTFDAVFSLPKEVFGMGYIEQLLPAKVFEGERCPGYLEHSTTECRLEWSGKVVFRKLWENTVTSGGEVLPPSTGPGDKPPAPLPPTPPAPPAPPADDDEIELVPLVEKGSATIAPGAKSASVTVSCATGCAGTVELVPLVARGSAVAAAARKPLARKRFTVRPGAAARVRVKLGARARRAVRRSGRARLRVRFTRPARSTQTVTVRLRRR